MTISDLISKLSNYPPDLRVALMDQDKGWLLPIEITRLPADCSTCGVDVLAITADRESDEIEGLFDHRSITAPRNSKAPIAS